MKTFKATSLLLLLILCDFLSATAQSGTAGIYVGGHFRRERPGTITQLKASGFSYVILFNINVETNGDLTTDGETICTNGNYVFGNTQPFYVSDVTSLKQGVTSIKRVESCIGGWGNHSYANIKTLTATQGTGTGSILYRNFQALKNAIPSMDAINNDDEETYDVNSATAFHVMLANLGYKSTLAPYMNKSFWQQLATNVNNQKPGSVDRIDLQWYDGGAGNNPCDWNINNIPLYTGDLNYADATSMVNKMTTAKNNCGAKGGFIWVYNDNGVNLRQLANRINGIYGGPAVTRGEVAVFYGDCNYGGAAVGLSEGTYTRTQLLAYGIQDNSLSSIKVNPGYVVKVFVDDNFSGTTNTFTNSDDCLVDNGLNDNISSIQITAKGISGFAGSFYIRSRGSKLYMDVEGAAVNDGANLLQWNAGFFDNQQFTFTELGNGIYRINGVKSGKSFNISDQNPLNAAQLQIWTYSGSYNQQYILVQNAEGYYQLIARHSGLALKVEGSSNTAGAKIKQAINDGSTYTQWLLTPVNSSGAVSFFSDCNYGGYKVSLGEGTYAMKDLIGKGISDNDISSLQVNQGYVVRIYVDNNQSGNNVLLSASDNCLTDNGFNDNISSLVIRANGVTGLNQQYFVQNRNSGQYLNLSGGSTANGGVIVQWPFENGDNEKFTFTDQGNGVYKIVSAKSGKAFEIAGANTNQGTVLQQWDYTNGANQKFIVVSTGDGFYKLIPTHTNQIIEVKDASTTSGYKVQQWGDNGQTCGQWKFIPTNDVPVISISAPANNTTYTSPATVNITATATDAFADITKVEFYNGATKLGEDATSPYTYGWTNVAAGTYTITAKATNQITGTKTSAVITFLVKNPNVAPTVTLTSPTAGTTFTSPATVTISANATDSDGSISKVEFYNGTTLLNSDNASPFTYNWTSVATGTYSITAKAYDNAGAVTTSAAVSITVKAPNVAPTVTLTSPAAGTTFSSPATVTVSANATDSDGSIAKVEFYSATTKIGEVTSSPYNFAWEHVGIGTYSLTAKAYDNSGAISTSNIILITVSQTTEIDDNTIVTKLTAYPNPTTGIINFSEAVKSVIVSDLTGKVLDQLVVTDLKQINLGAYTSGIYLLKLESDNGSNFIKIIKE